MNTTVPTALLPLAMIAAMSRNRVIGDQGRLPWREPEDQRHFRATTLEHALIMGRKTFDCLGRPLPRRRNIVISRQQGWRMSGVEVVATLEEAIALARTSDAMPFIGGGGEIYALALPLATRIYLTVVDVEVAGDAFFPQLEPGSWRESERRASGRLLFQTLERMP
jgi:dihydrofolate reductase